MKKIFFTIICLTLLFDILSYFVFASEELTNNESTIESLEVENSEIISGTCGNNGDNLVWILENGVLTISGTGEMADFTEIHDGWSDYRNEIRYVRIKEGVTSIGMTAFAYCYSLLEVNIPDSVTSIGRRAFDSCYALKKINLPKNIATIVFGTFQGCCALESINIPTNVSSIEDYAFFNCSGLTSVTIPENVSSIGGDAFRNCYALSNIYFSEGTNLKISSRAFENCTALTDIVFPSRVSQLDNNAFYGCGNIRINVENSNLKYNSNYIFEHAYPTFFGLKGSTTEQFSKRNNYPFYIFYDKTDNLIIEGKLGENIEFIFDSNTGNLNIIGEGEMYDYNSSAFKFYYDSRFSNKLISRIKKVTISDGITSIGNNVFSGCSGLQTILIPESVTSIGEYAFEYCHALQQLFIPNNVCVIGQSAFKGCTALSSIKIPDCVSRIEFSTFKGCSALSSVILPSSLDYIGSSAFLGCSALTSFVLPQQITTIENCTFEGCSALQDFFIGDDVKSIGENAFYNCYSLNSIKIPLSVKQIGRESFAFSGSRYRNNLKIYFCGDVPTNWGIETIDSGANFIIYYPEGNTSGWTSPTWTAPDGTVYNTATFNPNENLSTLGYATITSPNTETTYYENESITLSWTSVENAEYYKVEVRDITDGNNDKEENLVYLNENYTDPKNEVVIDGSNFVVGHTYRFAVGAFADGYETEGWAKVEITIVEKPNINSSVECLQPIGTAGNLRDFTVMFDSIPTEAYLQFDNQNNPKEWLSDEYCSTNPAFMIDIANITESDDGYEYNTSFIIHSQGVKSNDYARKVRVAIKTSGGDTYYSDSFEFIVNPIPPAPKNGIGYAYEQTMDIAEDIVFPSIDSVVVADKGDYYRITVANYTCDETANVFFYWRADGGEFKQVTDDFVTVDFIPDGKNTVNVYIGDRLGYISKYTLTLD